MKIEKRSVPQIVAEEMKKQISNSVFVEFLPGQQKLAEEFKVSVPSVIEALVLLERDGYIERAERGKKRKIVANRADRSACLNLLVISPPAHTLTTSNLELLEKAKLAWTSKFESSRCIHLHRVHRPMTLQELEDEIQVNHVRAILAFEATKEWVEALSKVNVPIHRFGGTSYTPRHGNSGFGHSIEKIITEGIEKLISMGHTKILTPITRSYLLETTTTVYHALLKSSGVDAVSFCPTFPIDNPASIQDFWKRQLSTLQPTAVLSVHLPVLYSLIGFCNTAKLTIPENISVVSLMNHEMLDFFEPKIVAPKSKHYERISLFENWINANFQEQGFIHLPLDLNDGESITRIN